jgi:hypothetical protein
LPFEVTLPSNAEMYAIARKDGTYDVAVWLKNSLWNRDARTLVADTSASASFTFGYTVDVDSFRPSVSDSVARLGSNVTQLAVRVDGKVTFFRVKP